MASGQNQDYKVQEIKQQASQYKNQKLNLSQAIEYAHVVCKKDEEHTNDYV
jgi:hypothetical protein